MQVKVLLTSEEKRLGLQHLSRIPDDTVYVFVGPPVGGHFHSRNVPEPFDLAFLDSNRTVICWGTMTPPDDAVQVPLGAVYALEAKSGLLAQLIVGGKFTLAFQGVSNVE
jgi:uncharacterized membrane protein (UPF0127 family)